MQATRTVLAPHRAAPLERNVGLSHSWRGAKGPRDFKPPPGGAETQQCEAPDAPAAGPAGALQNRRLWGVLGIFHIFKVLSVRFFPVSGMIIKSC